MKANLAPIEDALAGLYDSELPALKRACDGAPQIAPSLLAWIKSACDWEWHRRQGHRYALLPPEAAIDPSDDQVSVSAALMLRAAFDSALCTTMAVPYRRVRGDQAVRFDEFDRVAFAFSPERFAADKPAPFVPAGFSANPIAA